MTEHRIKPALGSLRELLKRVPLYTPLRRYRDARRLRRQFGEWSSDDQRRLEFYSRFMAPGETVFDIGANLGNRSKVFVKLGARVVAAEPQSACADFLRQAFARTPDFHLVQLALGASVGKAEIMISDAHTLSSLSAGWIEAVRESGRFADIAWDGREMVAVDTLDKLIAEFGKPVFIKIDVEGFEKEVIRGLSEPVRALSLEFACEYLDSTYSCIDHLLGLGEPRFNLSIGESMEFALTEWIAADAITGELRSLSSLTFGDLYVRYDV